MNFEPTHLQGLYEVHTTILGDHRGVFARYFCENDLQDIVGGRKILQINFSQTSKKGSLRGMHFQNAPSAEMKLIRCLKGRVYDVAVDLRQGSSTFQQWHAIELDAGKRNMVAIPEGFAHGFQALEDDCELLYLHTACYDKTAEGGVRYDDPALAIDWPLPVADISERDLNHPLIDQNFKGIIL